MLVEFTLVILVGSHLGQCQTSDALIMGTAPTLEVYAGDPFFMWCNLTSHQDLTVGFAIRWLKDGEIWCVAAISLQNTTKGECVNRSISINNMYNPPGTQDFQLSVSNATIADSGNHSCAVVVSSTSETINLNKFILVNVSEKTTAGPGRTTALPQTNKDSNPPFLSQTVIIGIGVGAGGGVLLVIIIIAVVCVKKKGKGNTTTGVNAKKPSDRKSNPLEKNAENLHYADLALHENPKSSSSKGTGSAKSKTLTVNPGDDRVEYAQVVKH